MTEKEASLAEQLKEIYSETTVDHILHPRNERTLSSPDGFAACGSGCGETMKIWLSVKNGTIQQSGFWTDGCAATIACGSMTTHMTVGLSVVQALLLNAQDIAEALESLPEGNFHCAELASRTLKTALIDYLSMEQQPWKKLYRR